jgi:hypothetical protein
MASCVACSETHDTAIDDGGSDTSVGSDANAEDAWVAPAPDAGDIACGSASTCTSGMMSTTHPSPGHYAGEACNACHAVQALSTAPFAACGTVFPTCHEPDQCNGLLGVMIEITDPDANVVATMTTNAAGNFVDTRQLLPPSFGATLTYAGRQAHTTTPHGDGDCNGCHTESGANGAAGRLFVP